MIAKSDRAGSHPSATKQVVDGVGDAVLVVGVGDVMSVLFGVINGVAHGDTAASGAEHGQVVHLVADGGDAIALDAATVGDPSKASPFVDASGENFEDVNRLGIIFALEGGKMVNPHAVAESLGQALRQFGHTGGRGDHADAKGVMQIIGRDVWLMVDLGAGEVEPPLGVVGELALAGDQVFVPGKVVFAKDENRFGLTE